MTDIRFEPNWEPVTPPNAPVSLQIVRPLDDESVPIIIAEDDPVSRRLVTAVIEAGGFRTVVTNDGNEAMTALRAQEGACIAVIDWMMPGMDGLEICRRVREVNTAIYIILLTARGKKENIVEGLRAGADDYLTKPFDKDELQARILVGVRIMALQAALAQRVSELELANAEIRELRLHLPI